MKAAIYELVTLHEKMQALEACERILESWQGFEGVRQEIRTEIMNAETRIKELINSKEL